MPKPGFVSFEDLIARAWVDPTAEAELRRRYETTAAIMVVDHSDMVHRSDAEGVVYALALARAAERAMQPALQEHEGTVVKRVADTWFAVFTDPLAALHAALQAQRLLASFNADRDGSIHDGRRRDAIHASIGLGWGTTLVLPAQDIYGAEVNRAFVLGEDTAGRGEVLATTAFWRAIGTPPPGIGGFTAPEARSQAAGFPFIVVADHRS